MGNGPTTCDLSVGLVTPPSLLWKNCFLTRNRGGWKGKKFYFFSNRHAEDKQLWLSFKRQLKTQINCRDLLWLVCLFCFRCLIKRRYLRIASFCPLLMVKWYMYSVFFQICSPRLGFLQSTNKSTEEHKVNYRTSATNWGENKFLCPAPFVMTVTTGTQGPLPHISPCMRLSEICLCFRQSAGNISSHKKMY